MQPLWQSVRWVSRKAFFLLALLVLDLLLILMPYMTVGQPVYPERPISPWIFHFDLRNWWSAVWLTATRIAHGALMPDVQTRQAQLFWDEVMKGLLPHLLVTLKLVGTALVLGTVLGIALGWLMSRLAPGWVRRTAFGVVTVLNCIPDLLIAVAMDLGLILALRALGLYWTSDALGIYQKFLGPALALTVLVVPYIARVTAAALEDVSGQLFIRTAMAKGLPRGQVLIKHMGKNVAIRIWTALPVVAGMLISGTMVVEYFTEQPGIGRSLMQVVAPGAMQGYRDPFAGVILLAPLLVVFTLVAAVSEGGLHWLDPRIKDRAQETGLRQGRRMTWKDAGRALLRTPRTFWETLQGILAWLAVMPASAVAWVRATPSRAKETGRALKDPVLLLGVLLVLGLVVVGLFAHKFAPYDPNKVFTAYQDKNGHIWAPPFLPSPDHLLGTDSMGRDVWSRLLFGTRYALLFAAMAVPARFLLALVLGLTAAWRGGIAARIISALGVFFTAVPQLVVPLVAISVFNRVYADNVVVSLAWGVLWVALPGVARLATSIRQQAETIFASPFIEGAVAAGAGGGRILVRHVLPQMATQLITMMTLEVPVVMTMTAALAYFKVAPGGWIYDDEMRGMARIPEWGSMMELPLFIIAGGKWWMMAPFAALFVAVLGFNLLGEGLRRRWAGSGEWQS